MTRFERIGVIGAGAWGTALAQACRAGAHEVMLWALEEAVVASITANHENELYLPGIKLDPGLKASNDIAAVAKLDLLLLVTPAQHLRAIAGELNAHVGSDTPLVICSKGVEIGSFALMSDVLRETLPGRPVAALSGPTFAAEVAQGKPFAVTVATADADLGHQLAHAIGGPSFRPYWHDDVIGVQIGGALKNVIAIACGIAMGREMGENARTALMARGRAEIVRYTIARGGRAQSLMGLSGLGDLALTCNSPKSRNMSLGIELGRGRSLAAIMDQRRTVAEGVHTAAAVRAEAEDRAIEMPLAAAVDDICSRGGDVDKVIESLLSRPFQPEFRQ